MKKGILIYKGMGIQIFSGTAKSASKAAKVFNQFRETLGDTLQYYAMLIPTHAAFYLPMKYQNKLEKDNIDLIYNELHTDFKTIDAYTEISKHTDEYIYFNTDHHWTGLGAYYAYLAFCETAGFEPNLRDTMETKVIPNFSGSFYRLTRDPTLKEKSDSVVYYKSGFEPLAVKAYKARNLDRAINSQVLVEFAKGESAYCVYLGADFPRVHIYTENKNGRKALLIKNSYGNPFTTYVAPHYEEIIAIDYRSYKRSLKKLIQTHGITDIIITHSTFSANTPSHIKKMEALIKY
jgi:hypothetical protein